MKKPKQDNEQNGEEGENWNEPEAGADWRKANFGRGEEIQLCFCAGWVKITCGWLKEEFLFRELVFYFRQIPIYIYLLILHNLEHAFIMWFWWFMHAITVHDLLLVDYYGKARQYALSCVCIDSLVHISGIIGLYNFSF